MCYSVRTLDKPMPGIDEKLRSSGLSPLGGVRSEDVENATDCDRSRLPTDGPHYKIGSSSLIRLREPRMGPPPAAVSSAPRGRRNPRRASGLIGAGPRAAEESPRPGTTR